MEGVCGPGQTVAVTIDVHRGDSPGDLAYTGEWLASAGVRATFFVPSALLELRRYRAPLRALPALGHEIGSHTHHHDAGEIDALARGGRGRLAFLARSKRLHEDAFREPPLSFRSPAWCTLGPAALEEIARLGYIVDSSATPQRFGFLSSTPFEDTWTFAPREPRYIRPGLLEVPTSTFLVPAGSPTFLIFRRTLSLAFVSMLLAEARLFPNRVVVLQLHPDDLNPASRHSTSPQPLRPMDFALRRRGGFGFKHHLKERNRSRISGTARAILELVAPARFATLGEIARSWREPPTRGDER
jgi:hypothetical protein